MHLVARNGYVAFLNSLIRGLPSSRRCRRREPRRLSIGTVNAVRADA